MLPFLMFVARNWLQYALSDVYVNVKINVSLNLSVSVNVGILVNLLECLYSKDQLDHAS